MANVNIIEWSMKMCPYIIIIIIIMHMKKLKIKNQ